MAFTLDGRLLESINDQFKGAGAKEETDSSVKTVQKNYEKDKITKAKTKKKNAQQQKKEHKKEQKRTKTTDDSGKTTKKSTVKEQIFENSEKNT